MRIRHRFRVATVILMMGTALTYPLAQPAAADDHAAEVLAPTISEFTPASGPVGTVVTILGTNLAGATKVPFHWVRGTVIKDTETRIKVKVPLGAATGEIKVTTPGGSVKTSSAFTVTTSLTYSGVLTGQLEDPVSSCQPLPNEESMITVNGNLNGTSWVLYIQSYDGQNGVWQVITGQAGGGTGLVGPGYAITATYPATITGVTQIDWARGATLNVQLTSHPGQTPIGIVEVQGTVTCG
jgi:hypothetical protein